MNRDVQGQMCAAAILRAMYPEALVLGGRAITHPEIHSASIQHAGSRIHYTNSEVAIFPGIHLQEAYHGQQEFNYFIRYGCIACHNRNHDVAYQLCRQFRI